MTLGAEIEHTVEEFDLDEDEPVHAERRERDFTWLVVNGLGEHWSAGATGDIESSTFDNIKLAVSAAPAIRVPTCFSTSTYTRRQLRAMYAVGGVRNEYYDHPVREAGRNLPLHEISL